MRMKKLLSWLLLITMVLTSFLMVSCKDNEEENPEGEIDEDMLSPSFDGVAKKYSGEFKVLTETDRSAGQAFNIVDLDVDGNLGDVAIKAAVQERNDLIKKNFGVKIKRTQDKNPQSTADKMILGEDDTYDAYMLSVSGGLTLACKGGIINLESADLEYLDLSRKWWDQGIKENLLLDGGAYIAVGDLLTVDKDATWCVLFNEYCLETKQASINDKSLYKLVEDGNGNDGGWTVDVLKTYASQYYTEENNTDTNGFIYAPGYAGNGMYGLYMQTECSTVLLQASGFTPTKLSPTEVYGVVANMDTQFDEAVGKVKELYGDSMGTDWFLSLDDVTKGAEGEDKWRTVARASFINNRATFFMCHVGTIDLIQGEGMQSSFGVLPVPKLYSTGVKEYSNTIQYGNAHCYVIQDRSEKKNERAGYILEALCYYSSEDFADTNSLSYAYNEKVLRGKGTEDVEAWAMLDYIFDNRTYDLACALNLSAINGNVVRAACAKDGQQWSSIKGGMADLNISIQTQLKTLSGAS